MPNPYTFVNWGLLGEGKAPPANGLYFNNKKLGDVLVSVWREAEAGTLAYGGATLYYGFDMYLGTNFINTGGVANPPLINKSYHQNPSVINKAFIPVSIAEELGLGGEYGHPDKFYSERGSDDEREGDDDEILWDMRLKEEYWHLLNPYWQHEGI